MATDELDRIRIDLESRSARARAVAFRRLANTQTHGSVSLAFEKLSQEASDQVFCTAIAFLASWPKDLARDLFERLLGEDISQIRSFTLLSVASHRQGLLLSATLTDRFLLDKSPWLRLACVDFSIRKGDRREVIISVLRQLVRDQDSVFQEGIESDGFLGDGVFGDRRILRSRLDELCDFANT